MRLVVLGEVENVCSVAWGYSWRKCIGMVLDSDFCPGIAVMSEVFRGRVLEFASGACPKISTTAGESYHPSKATHIVDSFRSQDGCTPHAHIHLLGKNGQTSLMKAREN